MATEAQIKEGITTYKPEKCDQEYGYVLYNSRMLEKADLIDLEGNLIHGWVYPQGYSWHYAEILPNGHLAAIIKETEGDVPGMQIEFDWDGNVVRRFDVPAHHDFEYLANGNVIILCREYVDRPDIYVPTADDPAPTTKSDCYYEIDPNDNIVWEWHADQHAMALKDFVDIDFPREHRDWAHTNTIEVLPPNPTAQKDPRFAAGNVLFSMRAVSTIGVIDKPSGEVVWAWGPGTIEMQHMPTMLENGNLLIYDNGYHSKRTRIVELDPITEKIEWQYVADPPESFFSPSRGSNQRLSNGNTHIADSDSGRLFEVTSEGEIVWEFLNPDLTPNGKRQPLYRSMRYEKSFIDQFRS